MDNNFGLPDRTINEILSYFRTKPEIEKVIIYGSRAKDTFQKGSDIDFAIWTDGNISHIASELDELPTPYKFDIVDYKNLIHEGLKDSINKDGKLFYQK